jgi:formylglycine-generating enzyme required for sulfatase activity
MPHIFISYAKKETRYLADVLFSELNQIDGLTAWMDVSLEPDDYWAAQIEQEIDKSDYVIVLLSPDVNRPPKPRRSFVLNEIDYALQDDKPILPVMVFRTKLPVQIAGLQYIDLTKPPNHPNIVINRVCRRFGIEPPWERQQREAALRTHKVRQVGENNGAAKLPIKLSSSMVVLIGILVMFIVGGIFVFLGALVLLPKVLQAENTRATHQVQETETQIALNLTATQDSIRVATDIVFNLDTLPPSPTPTATYIPPTPEPEVISTIPPSPTTDPLPALYAPAFNYDDSQGNRAWSPVIYSFSDNIPMVLAPPGCFTMGSDVGEVNERPPHIQCFDNPFWIDQTEVTQADFSRLGGQKSVSSNFNGARRPVEMIDWMEAQNFCALRGMRLPMENEREYAARGPESWTYPWGNDWNPDNVVWAGNNPNQTAVVSSRPAGMSWVGAYDMSGNVWEWIYSIDSAYPYVATDGREASLETAGSIWRTLRGGSWMISAPGFLRSHDRHAAQNYTRSPEIGFRCVRPYR